MLTRTPTPSNPPRRMRTCRNLLALGIAAVAPPAAAAERAVMMPSITPQPHAGQAYVAVRLLSDTSDTLVRYAADRREATLRRGSRSARLRVGSRTALLNGRPATLPRAPYLVEGNMMVPVRTLAAALDIPLQYDEATASLLFKPRPNEPTLAVPLPTRRAGIVIHSPEPGAETWKGVRVHGQANTPDGPVVIQLLAEDGHVLQETTLPPGGSGAFREFNVSLIFANSNGGALPVRVVAYSPRPGDGAPRYRLTIPVTLHPSGP